MLLWGENPIRARLLISASILLAPLAGALHAAERLIEEIVVTAQRIEEGEQSVPIALTAFSEAMIEDRRILGLEQLRAFVPNLNFTTTNIASTDTSIRGIGASGSVPGAEAGVSLHMNQIPLPTGRLQVIELFDVERIEVLRGPQGTLYGRNATGGVVNLITQQPSLDGLGGYVDAETGNYGLLRLRGAVNVPFGDRFAVRVAGLSLNREGYTKNLAGKQIPGVARDLDGRDLYGVRASVAWQITERTRATVRYERYEENDDRLFFQNNICRTSASPVSACEPNAFGFQAKSVTQFPVGVAGGMLGLTTLGAYDADTGLRYRYPRPDIRDPRDLHSDHNPSFDVDQDLWQLDVEQAFDWGTLSLSGSYLDFRGDVSVDNEPAVGPELNPLPEVPDGLYRVSALPPGIDALSGEVCSINAGLAGALGGCVFGEFSRFYGYAEARESNEYGSAELKLRTTLEGRVNVLVGVNYQGATTKTVQGNFHNTPADTAALVGFLNSTGLFLRDSSPAFRNVLYPPLGTALESELELDSVSGFGELYLDFSDDVKLTLGLRYNRDEKEIVDRNVGFPSAVDFNSPAILNGALGDGPVWARIAAFDPVLQPLLFDYYGVDEDTDPLTGAFQIPIVEQPNEQRLMFGAPTEQTWDAWTGRIAIDWQAGENLMVYGSYARGYKPGGFNTGVHRFLVGDAPLTHDREDVNAFEVGAKGLVLEGTLSFNVAAFFNDYDGMQLARPRFDIQTGGSGNTNVDAETYGVELETRWRPAAVPRAELELGYSWLHTELEDRLSWIDPTWLTGGDPSYIALSDWLGDGNFVAPLDAVRPLVAPAIAAGVAVGPDEAPAAQDSGVPVWFSRGFLDANGVQTLNAIPFDLAGNRIPDTPEHTLHLAASYTWDIVGGALTARWDYYWQDEVFLEVFNHSAFRVDSWDQHNATLVFEGGSGRWSARAWIVNIEDEVHLTGGRRTTLNTAPGATEPRTYGASLRYNFGIR